MSPAERAEAALAACVATFQLYLHLPDPAALYVTLATVAVNRAEGDPLWVLLVGPPGGGKTEILGSVTALPDVFPTATLTEAALLSGTPKREKAESAKGGLLREIGAEPAILLCKDFGSVLSMNRDARASVLAALREVYDGSWTRHLGTDGGRTLSWEGKVGLLGGVTPAVDSHHAVMGSLGERFLLFRLPEVDADAQAHRALEHLGNERKMRVDLARTASDVLQSVETAKLTAPAIETLSDELVALATLTVRARSAVERDAYSREVTLIPQSEAPARFTLVLLRLWNGLRAIGLDEQRTRDVVAKAALDSMPQVRRQVLQALVERSGRVVLSDLAEAIGYPVTTSRRACEDLAGHGLVERIHSGNGDKWRASTFATQRWPLVPEKSEGIRSLTEKSEATHSLSTLLCTNDDKTGTVPYLNPDGDARDLTLDELDALEAERSLTSASPVPRS